MLYCGWMQGKLTDSLETGRVRRIIRKVSKLIIVVALDDCLDITGLNGTSLRNLCIWSRIYTSPSAH